MSDRLTLTLPPDVVDAIAERAAELVLASLDGASSSPWLSVRDAATYLGVSERSLERAIARGRVRSSTVGSRRLLHRDDLDAYLRGSGGGEDSANRPCTPPRR
jgi:excisionase family DNA binding protein